MGNLIKVLAAVMTMAAVVASVLPTMATAQESVTASDGEVIEVAPPPPAPAQEPVMLSPGESYRSGEVSTLQEGWFKNITTFTWEQTVSVSSEGKLMLEAGGTEVVITWRGVAIASLIGIVFMLSGMILFFISSTLVANGRAAIALAAFAFAIAAIAITAAAIAAAIAFAAIDLAAFTAAAFALAAFASLVAWVTVDTVDTFDTFDTTIAVTDRDRKVFLGSCAFYTAIMILVIIIA